MIPEDYITEWGLKASWKNRAYLEQDLIISRLLVELFSHPELSRKLAFRGGTALYKLYILPPARYSEFEENLAHKMESSLFMSDISPILASHVSWDMVDAAKQLKEELLSLLPGEPWQKDAIF